MLYVLLSGLSPFLDESPEETRSNIQKRDFCFPDKYFAGISQDAKDCINTMLVTQLRYDIQIQRTFTLTFPSRGLSYVTCY